MKQANNGDNFVPLPEEVKEAKTGYTKYLEIILRLLFFDSTKPSGNPENTIYTAQTSESYYHVVSNGRQTDTIAKDLARGKRFNDSLRRWENEGQEADYTARIVGVCHTYFEDIFMGRISRNPLNFEYSVYSVYEINVLRGYGFFVTTYNGEGGTEPSLNDPLPICLPGSLEDNLDQLWNTLDSKTRVALAGREIEKGSGRFRYGPIKNARFND